MFVVGPALVSGLPVSEGYVIKPSTDGYGLAEHVAVLTLAAPQRGRLPQVLPLRWEVLSRGVLRA